MLSNTFLKVFNNIWPMLVVFIVSISLIRIFYLFHHKGHFCLHKEFGSLLTIIYFWLLFEILTMSELNTSSGMNLVPFSEILRYKISSKMFYYNVFGNILIFLPFGYLIGSYVKSKNIWPVILTTLLTSVVVEFVQLQIGRSFDIDDILLNIVGGIIGYLLYIMIKKIKKYIPEIFKSDLFYNILVIIFLIIFGLYLWRLVY